MKNKEFWKGTLAGGLVVAVLGTGVFYGELHRREKCAQ